LLGHNYTCWLNFKGGKGIATSAGILAALVPWALLIITGIWLVLFVVTRYVSLASIAASVALPFAVWVTEGSLTMIGVGAVMAGLAIYRHRSNIQRLLQGNETRLALRKREAAP
jgi:glycerol-3-phosphate acyltransferase PlsY